MSTLRSATDDQGHPEPGADDVIPSEAPVRTGDILAGKYRVERLLGQGGMGVVVAAMHVQLEERVAIKFLLPEALQNPDTVTRFLREAQAAVRIKNEHVARVADIGTLENGAPFMVMEYLDGQDLSDLVKSRGGLPVLEAVDYLLQTCEAIAEAHSLGIIHRDLKPSNLFLTKRTDGTPLVKVLDFGISKVKARSTAMQQAALTKTASVMGSPLYMAPEQMVSTRDVDARADIWALGVVLYQLLAATAPFTGDTMTELCARILQEPPPPLRAVRPDVHPGLEAVVLRCLEKDRERRYTSVGEFAAHLAQFAGAHSRLSAERVIRMGSAASIGHGPTSVSDAGYPPPPPARNFAPTPPQPPPPVVQGSTLSSWGHTQGTGSGGGRGWIIGVVAAGAVAAGALVGVVIVISNGAHTRSSAAATATVKAPDRPATTLDVDPDSPLPTLNHPTTTSGLPTHKPAPTASASAAKPSSSDGLTIIAPPPTQTAPPPPVPSQRGGVGAPPAPTTTKPDIF